MVCCFSDIPFYSNLETRLINRKFKINYVTYKNASVLFIDEIGMQTYLSHTKTLIDIRCIEQLANLNTQINS